MNEKNFIIIVFAVLLVGCAPGGAKNVKADYSNHETFYVNENYQSTYRKIARKMAECFYDPQAGLPHMNLYQDIRLGEFSYGNMFGTFIVIEIAGIEETKSKVDIYTGVATWNKYISKVKGWIDGTYTEC